MKGKETIQHGDKEYSVSIFDDGSYNCPECPYTKSFETERTLKMHITSFHGNYARSTKYCKNCGEKFTHLDKEARKYCSRECSKDDRYNR